MKNIKKKNGRPSKYTKELSDEICALLSQGLSLRSVCRIKGMPDITTIFEWMRVHPDFSPQYALATNERTEAQHEDLLELGDEAIKLSQTVDTKVSGAVVQAVKLKADNMKWSMSKMKPKKYGDKVDVTSDGKAIKGNTLILKDFKEE